MAKKKLFTMERYEEIKKLLTDNKVSSSDLDNYLKVKELRYQRHQELNTFTDTDIESIVNDIDIPNTEGGKRMTFEQALAVKMVSHDLEYFVRAARIVDWAATKVLDFLMMKKKNCFKR